MPETKKPSRKSALDTPIPDRAAMAAYIAAVPADQREEALAEAQDMIYEAWEKQTSHSRKVRAHKALAVSPLCADAYNLLASETIGGPERRDLHGLALEAAELALGPGAFEAFKGHFWMALETRPYMRARQGLAMTLANMGDEPAAIEHFRALLELNPGDNQGIRYLLLRSLLRLDDIPALKALLGDYPDEASVYWAYTRLLVAYRDGEGSTPATRKLLNEALSANAHVSALLAGEAQLVFSPSGFLTSGGADQATDYKVHHGEFWRKTPGAIEWLASEIAGLNAPKPRRGKEVR